MIPVIVSGRFRAAASVDMTITAPGGTLIDTSGNRWGIVSGLVTFNGVSVASPTSVLNLTIVSGVVWAETSPTVWFRMVVNNGVATTTGGAQNNPLPTITGITLSNASFTPTGSVAGTVVGTITVNTTNGTLSPTLSTLTLSGTDAARFQIVSGVLQLASTQASGSFAVNIIATQTLAPGSPFTSAKTITGTSLESAAGTTVTTVGPSINASPTPGSAGFGNVLTITSGATINNNGAALGGAAVDMLYYIGSTAYQRGNALWWGPITATSTGIGPVNDPRPTMAISGLTVPQGSPTNTTVGTISTTVGAGTYAWVYTLSGTNAGSFSTSGSLLRTVGALANGSYGPFTITATPSPAILGGPFTLNVTVVVTVTESQAGTSVTTVGPTINASTTPGTAGTGNLIAITSGAQIQVNGGTAFGSSVNTLYYIGNTAFQKNTNNDWYGPITATDGGAAKNDPHPTVALSNLSVATMAVAGSAVGTISVAVGAGTYTWTYSLSGANAASFQLSGSNLQTSAPLAAGAYAIIITATNAAIIGSPFTLSTSITVGLAAGGVSWPAVGLYGGSQHQDQDLSLAQDSHQVGNVWPCKILYNHYWDGWTEWAQTDGDDQPPYPPYLSIQCSPGPRNSNVPFNASDWATNHQANFNQLAQNINALGDKVVSIQLGYEWNQGGAFNGGWDTAGNQLLYIQWMRNVCTAFQTYAPNVIRCWAMNHNTMQSGTVVADWYPGDDKIDAIGMEWYLGFAGAPAGGGLNNFPWLAQMCAQTYLGPNHPAKATGSMMVNGVSTSIPIGKQKYIVLAEGQAATAVDPNGITNLFNWVAQQNGRVLVIVYWNAYLVGTDNGQDLLLPGTTSRAQWVAANNNKVYPHPWPIPRFT